MSEKKQTRYSHLAAEYAALCLEYEERAAHLTNTLTHAFRLVPEPPSPFDTVLHSFNMVMDVKARKRAKGKEIEATPLRILHQSTETNNND